MDSRLKEIFIDCIRIDATSSKEKPMADYIRSFLLPLGYTITEDDASKYSESNTGNIHILVGNNPEFALLSHMDTARSTKGVTPKFLSDRITSDGSTVLGVDNRAGIATILFTLEKIAKEKITTKSFCVAFTTCEETTLEGSRRITFPITPPKAIVLDSYLSPGAIINKAFGAIAFKITINGKATHAAIAPEKGIHAISIAADVLKLIPNGKIDGDVTINVGKINGGSETNVVPDLTVIEGEIRAMEQKKALQWYEKIVADIQGNVAEKAVSIDYEYRWDFEPYTINENSDVYMTVKKAFEQIGIHAEPRFSWGGSDANSLNAKGIDAVNLGIGAQNPHGNDEFILYEDFENTKNLVAVLTMNGVV